ncbi:MAG: 4-hydroxy-3-methylbut-2-enyl diphosphate reductase [Candidatus Eisenbacteria bacterium]|nr:4-hydroxy-3-methylbut-2-enyl diphosphate reductase [Candidatus Latescibacterota bacterium]MBD3303263.1 4-hydroxy-3-methylbut-2-enyl diphosphate reductase [Candidatus Eisenbacteria bacterium]
MSESRYVRKGFGNTAEIRPLLEGDYRSRVVEWLVDHDRRLEADGVTIRLAREFGFCYGVDRAVEYAYETRKRFPDRRIFITGEIIHNPRVNRRLEEMRIHRLPEGAGPEERLRGLTPEDVVLIPAFGIERDALDRLKNLGATLVDTTCGSVLNVWKSVGRYARDGYTAVVHGKHAHEETRATCSQVRERGGAYLVVRDLEQAERVGAMIEGRLDAEEFLREFAPVSSPGFDPDRDLRAVGLANQTTMLSSESLEIADRLRRSMIRRYGEERLAEHFRSFDTICSATQDRQDAVHEMLEERLDLLVVIGGYNSSNTGHLLEIGSRSTRSYHIAGANDLLSRRWLRHKPIGDPDPVVTADWLAEGPAVIGVTAGASTPNSEVGRTILRLLELRGVPEATLAERFGATERI